MTQGRLDSPHANSRFVLDSFEPAYLGLRGSGGVRKRARRALKGLESCCACPRNCRVNRAAGETRVCGTGRYARIASASPHFGEEECLRGWNGSGTVFFALCNLRCVFCQNWDISQRRSGVECSPGRIAELMIGLQRVGCHNINFVTPEHVVPQVIEAVAEAIELGLSIPIVYNTSAYDSFESLRLLDGIVDIYMPDFKFWSVESSRRYLGAEDYPDRAREAILEMHRQVGPLRIGSDGVARRGLLVRHLVMPGLIDETRAILQWLAENVSRDTFVNIMAQYRPEHLVGERTTGGVRFEEINRRPARGEIDAAYGAAREAGLWRFD